MPLLCLYFKLFNYRVLIQLNEIDAKEGKHKRFVRLLKKTRIPYFLASTFTLYPELNINSKTLLGWAKITFILSFTNFEVTSSTSKASLVFSVKMDSGKPIVLHLSLLVEFY